MGLGDLARAVAEHLLKGLPFQRNVPANFTRGSKLQTLLDPLATDGDFVGMGIALVDLTRAGMEYAGVRDTRQMYGASLVKIAVMFAAFRLRESVINVEKFVPAKDRKEFFAKVTDGWRPAVEAAASSRRPDFPKLDQIFALTGPLDFNGDFRKQLTDMVQLSKNEAAAECIHRLGYQYINGALAAAGLFDSAGSGGLWVGGDYVSGDYAKVRRYEDFEEVPVDKGVNKAIHDPRGVTTQGATAEAVARFLALVDTNQLVSPQASQDMRVLMRGQVLDSDFKTGLKKRFTLTDVYGKIGVGVYGRGNGDDCAVVERMAVVSTGPNVEKKIRYVAVGLREPVPFNLEKLIHKLDRCIVQNNAP
jgi:hypothetical protein